MWFRAGEIMVRTWSGDCWRGVDFPAVIVKLQSKDTVIQGEVDAVWCDRTAGNATFYSFAVP